MVKSNSLATLNPDLTLEWHPIKNGKLTPNDVGINTGKRVWWKCPEGDDHEWKTTVHHRTLGLGCPVCSNQKVVLSNCLATVNPELAKQLHPTKNGKLSPYDIGAGSGKSVWWKCPKGEDHIWRGTIGKRNTNMACPICIGRKVVNSNSFGTLFPELTKQWHPTKNEKLTPYDLRPGSTIKVWWVCSRGDDHIWKTAVKDRTQGTGCPKCNPSTSIPELRIFCELKSIFPSTQHRFILKGYEVDIYIPEIEFGIEYDGSYWHKDKIQKDQEKNLALQSSIFLLRMREKGLPKLANTDIIVSDKISVSIIKKILRSILKHRQVRNPVVLDNVNEYFKNTDWLASNLFDKFQADRNYVEFENSLSYLFPDLAKQWHPTKNGLLLSEYLTPESKKRVWWQNRLGHEWQATISGRVGNQRKRIISGQLTFFEDQE